MISAVHRELRFDRDRAAIISPYFKNTYFAQPCKISCKVAALIESLAISGGVVVFN